MFTWFIVPLVLLPINPSNSLKQEQRAKLGIYAFSVSEIKHPKNTKDIKFFYNNVEFKLNDIIYTRDKFVEIKVTWNDGETKYKAIVELELFSDGWISDFDLNILEIRQL